MSIDKEIIKNKIKDIELYFKEIQPFLKMPKKEILNDYLKLRTLERNYQLIVDTMVSINTHLISALNLTAPDDFQSTFTTLGQNQILPGHFAIKLAPIVGLRNKIVHKYGEIDQGKFILDLQRESSDFQRYCRLILKYISQDKK